MSRATRCTLAWPCLPVFEVDISTILQGRFWQKYVLNPKPIAQQQCSIAHLDHDKASLPERRTLHGESLGSSRVSLVEVVVLVVRHFDATVEFSETYVSNMEAVGKGAVELRFIDDVQLSIIYDHQLTSKVSSHGPCL